MDAWVDRHLEQRERADGGGEKQIAARWLHDRNLSAPNE